MSTSRHGDTDLARHDGIGSRADVGESELYMRVDILSELPRGRARVSFHHICRGDFPKADEA